MQFQLRYWSVSVILQSRPALGLTQPTIQWVKERVELSSTPPGCVVSYFLDSYKIFQYLTCNGSPKFPFCDFHTSGPADRCAFQLVMPMAMSEEHPFFRLLCFHRNLVRFVFHCSATSRDLDTHRYSKPSTIRLVSFMWLLEHVRTRSAACGAITRSS